jgi:hypothetical protein
MKIKITTDFGSEELPKVGDILHAELLDGVYWCVWRGIDLPVHAGYFEIIP